MLLLLLVVIALVLSVWLLFFDWVSKHFPRAFYDYY